MSLLINKLSNLNNLSNLFFNNSIDCTEIPQISKSSEEFIREFHDKVDWDFVSMYQKLSDDFIMEFRDRVNWKYIIKYQTLNEYTINSCIDYLQELEFAVLWEYQILSEDFIRNIEKTAPYRIYWNIVSKYQKLSEEFIREFQDNVYWFYIAMYQNLSENFLIEFKNEVEYDIVYNKCIKYYSVRMIKEFKPKLNGYYKYNYAANIIQQNWLKYYYKPGNRGHVNAVAEFERYF
jgi:hypothetical protein